MTFPFPVFIDDDDVLVIDKPPGIVVNRSGTQREKTVEDLVSEYIPSSNSVERHGIVHRLDKETSGILVIAKTSLVLMRLHQAFAERIVRKKYIALIHGQLAHARQVEQPIGRNPKNREKFTVLARGRPAETVFSPRTHYRFSMDRLDDWRIRAKPTFSAQYKRFTLVEVSPRTGRTHQIRVHAKWLGHPVVADHQYAGRKVNRIDRKWCPRLFLHASFLAFPHPRTEKVCTVKSPLPEDLVHALTWLEGL